MTGFWRSVNLTGNQTNDCEIPTALAFWRSVNLTGNQTGITIKSPHCSFWRSVNLTGNQTAQKLAKLVMGFGAVSI